VDAPPPNRSPARPAPTPPRRPPWRNLWKGPLPPARVSAARTLADFLPPAFSAADGDCTAARSPDVEEGTVYRDPVPPHPVAHNPVNCDPVPRRTRDPNPIQLLRTPTPIGLGQGEIVSPSPNTVPPPPNPVHQPGRRRRLVNAVTPQHILSSTPYRDALMAGRGPHIRRQGIGGRGPQVGGRGTTDAPASGTDSHGEAPATDHGQEPCRSMDAGLTPSPRRLLGPTCQTAPRARGLGVAVAVMGGPGMVVRSLLINHVGNAATTLQQTSFITSLPRKLCRLLRAAKGRASALWSALFALMTTSPTSVRFSVAPSRRLPIVLPLMTIKVFFSYPGS
jgi:hypothetical protein